jgi:cyanobactin maturation PatA/PatG family protease
MLATSQLISMNTFGNAVAIAGLKELWAQTCGDSRIRIAVLDGPVDLTHPSFARTNLKQLETLLSGERKGDRSSEHGTHISSIIFGGHDGAVMGIAPRCSGLIVPIFSAVVDGSPVACSQLDLARALLQAVQAGANIINISGGEFSSSGRAHPLLAETVLTCSRQNALIVAAAGNQGCNCLQIPGALPTVLAVGAMDAEGQPLSFSNWGRAYQSQGILAPGENILGATVDGGTTTASGTSVATAIVSGVAALMMSLQLKRGRKPDVESVRAALLQSALGCTTESAAICQRLLAGRLNVRGAMSTLFLGERSMSEIATPIDSSPDETPDGRLGVAQLSSADATFGSFVGPPSRPVLGLEPGIAPSERQSSGPILRAGSTPAALNAAICRCGCGGAGGTTRQLVYALGEIGFDFGTEARRDAFIQAMENPAPGVTPNPFDVNQVLNYLEGNPWDAAALTWTLSLDGMTIYAMKPEGAFAGAAYERFRQFLKEQSSGEADRVSIPGIISGQVRLLNGQVVPVVAPEIRGMYNWTTSALLEAAAGLKPGGSAPDSEQAAHSRKIAGVRNFLERIYYELRNLGITPQQRAMNYAGTNAFQIEKVYETALKEEENTELESIEVEPSPVCRPDSDCWDVRLYFFFPDRQVQTVRKVFRFAVDVSDVIPVTVGPVRSWFVR